MTPLSRRSDFRVQINGVHFRPGKDGDQQFYGDWRWLAISDVNGAILHQVLVREGDLPDEIAVGIQRAVMSHYEGRDAGE